MISIPDREASSLSFWSCLMRGVPRAYAVLFFSPSRRLGWTLLAISLLTPDIGLSGLGGALAAGMLALALGFDRGKVGNGYLLFNPLLVCLTLGLMNRVYAFPFATFLILWVGAILGAFFFAVALQSWIGRQAGLSAQSIPATTFAYLLYFLAFSIARPAFPPPAAFTTTWLDATFLPSFWRSFFETFGAMIFEPRVLPGLGVFLALAAVSPLATLVATASFAVGVETMSLLGFPMSPEGIVWCGFNFLLGGIALGTAYFAPSRASLLLALTCAFLCALIAPALATALHTFGLPPSALPYNLIVLTLVFALRQRTTVAGLHPSPAPGMLPESAGRFVALNAARFPHLDLPALNLPFKDDCVISQGIDGALTHRAPWNWALDFEIALHGQRWTGAGDRLEDYHTFDRIVLAPCDGTVAAVVGHIRDNAPGGNNPEENWGNYLVIYADGGWYVLLAHLRQGSSLVAAGQRVIVGQPVARCGNSGRSPLPHLHVQVQDTPYPGTPTRPFCLRHYLEVATPGATPRYRTSGLPREGAQLASPTELGSLHRLFSNWLPGEYRYRIASDDGRSREETILLDFDDSGRFRLRSRRHGSTLTAFLSHHVFYMVDYDGPGDSLLAHLAVALARVPCVADPGLRWSDLVSPVPFHTGFLRRLHGLADPYLGPGLLEYHYAMVPGETGFEITARLATGRHDGLPRQTPEQLAVTVAPHLGLRRLDVRLRNDIHLTAELIDPAPPDRPAAGGEHSSAEAAVLAWSVTT
jgi:urea transporter